MCLTYGLYYQPMSQLLNEHTKTYNVVSVAVAGLQAEHNNDASITEPVFHDRCDDHHVARAVWMR
jgi:hypothetical protein